ncbi:MAG TPA: endonuclease/exonuclease/phosphatase family protein, partial [Armatimonadota bacterium]|nr:endonuclease/exonuclease/phosphatase family protein [Armatimonadota bacterium]
AVRLRNKQTSQILDQLPTDKPAVLCGDLNTPPNSAIYRILKSEMIDAFMETGSGFGLSYYRKLPLVRIDHIMVTPNITPVRCWMPKTAVSNHKPVCADLDI